MKEDAVVQIRHFFVRNNNFIRNKTVNNPYRIVLFPKSQMSACIDPEFPIHKFIFKDFKEINAIEDANEEVLFDIIGVLVGKGFIKDQNNAKLIELVLEDSSHNKMYCTLWKEYVDSFRMQATNEQNMLPIVIIQFCRPTLYKGKGDVRVCTSRNVSRLFVNCDIEEITKFRELIVSYTCIGA
ncbi:replication protein A 70 kDa DNA-binding subunit A-like [Salvia miltiorrhiza]|uniref:replication protein A 70 kDa DNA-binding subunit A-like n=1 Tax=Salvia miltiorrhiza TaxID=226208 RepID=UPI0025ACF76D|nr:replication protein A 70 kDa DNA-binding subunit A-like [Salvia miltiorrhiza]